MKTQRPPRIAAWLLNRMSHAEERLSISGDYEEIFEDLVHDCGLRAARSWYWSQTLKSLPMFSINSAYGSAAMFKNYLKLAYRNILKHKRYALLNIAGLAVGLASCLLMAGYVIHELSYESMHPLKDRIFRINGSIPMGGRTLINAVVAAPFGPAAEESIPEIEESVRVLRRHNVPVRVEDRDFKEERILFAEPSLLEIFSLSFVRGSRSAALEAPFTVVLTESQARKYFGTREPLGQTIRLTVGQVHDFQVTGIIKDLPSNTILRNPVFASFATLQQIYREAATQWVSWGSITTFFLLRDGTDVEALDAKLTELARSHLSEKEQDASYFLQPLQSIYIGKIKNTNNDMGNDGSLTRIYIFSGIAALILLIAAINFINLSTAKIAGRLKEVGIRKTCGAVRPHLIKQFLTESLLLTTVAMALGLLLFVLFKPRLDRFLGESLNLGLLTTPWILPIVGALILVVGFLAGSYPAFFLSRFPAAVIFRPGAGRGPSKSGMRRALVGLQFFIAIALITCTLVVLKQVRYSEGKDLGYDHDNLIVLRHRSGDDQADPGVVKSQILNRTGAVSAASLGRFPSAQNRSISTIRTEVMGSEEGAILQSLDVCEDFLPTMGLTLAEGRNFQAGRAADAQSVLINETAVSHLELEDPLGKFLLRGDKQYQIIGVLKDWNTNSIHSPIYPTVLFHLGESAGDFLIRLPSSGRSQETIAKIREIWSGLLPDHIFDYAYVADLHINSYSKEKRLASILISFCELTVLVACLGIFGLAAYSTEQRTKEIGIRKVLGSGAAAIVVLLSKSYVRWVLMANIFAWPAAYFVVNKWLQDFAYRTPLGLGPFLMAGILALAVAVFSVIFQALKAALSDPAQSLRYE